VIVRILAEGQYDLDESHHHRLDELDDLVVAAVDAGDEARYDAAFAELLDFVRAEGSPHDDEDLVESDFILPPADLSFDEAGQQFSGEGLIPDPPGTPA
jgi:hypothetical protein